MYTKESELIQVYLAKYGNYLPAMNWIVILEPVSGEGALLAIMPLWRV